MFGLENYEHLLSEKQLIKLKEILDKKQKETGYWVNELDNEFLGVYDEEEII